MSLECVEPRRPPCRPAPVAWAALTAGVLLVWAAYSWPLPLRLGRGIPCSSQNIELGSARRMMPNDSLQLLFQYWLTADMVAGRTPWFCNVYEFNTGDDAAHFRIHARYMPFSLVYAAASAFVSRAAAMNLTGLASLWLTAVITWRLARRYADSEWVALAAGLVSILLPFRWAQMFGGSPAGHAMAWVPLICLGVDVVLRDLRPSGGAAAGAGLLFAFGGDSHVFWFGSLAAAGWAVVALAARGGFPWRDRAAWRHVAKAAAAAALFLLPVALLMWLKVRHLATTTAGVERALREIRSYAPIRGDFHRWAAEGIAGHVYLGWVLPLTLAAAGVFALLDRDPAGRGRRRAFWLLAAAGGLVVLLAMGPHGPRHGLVWRIARALAPPYRLIRQPAKVFSVLPTLLAVAAAAGWGGRATTSRPRVAPLAVLAGLIAVAVEYGAQVRITICDLDDSQAAYGAVAARARALGRPPRALVLPLWPGDSATASVYQHYASLYRIRLANGYSPAVPVAYVEGFFKRFRDFNHGELDDERLDELLDAGIDALILHEDSSEKVSPFPVGYALERLRRHPRLEPLAREGRVWAFAIRPAAGGPPTSGEPPPPLWSPSRRLECERAGPKGWEITDPACSGGAFGTLAHPGDRMDLPRVPSALALPCAWHLRVRGRGVVVLTWYDESGKAHAETPVTIATSDEWSWQIVDLPPDRSAGRWALSLSHAGGRVDLDVALFMAGGPLTLGPGAMVRIPAMYFFRAGHAVEGPDGPVSAVRLERDRDPADRVFYGPWRRLAAGRYRLRLLGRLPTSVPSGTPLGVFIVEQPAAPPVEVVAGTTKHWVADAEVVQGEETPLVVAFRYTRSADVVLDAMEVERIE